MEKTHAHERDMLAKEIMQGMYNTGQVLTWYRDKPEGWKLASGLWSPFYINERSMPSHPKVFQKAVLAVGSILLELGYKPYGKDKIVGLAMAGVPLASGLSVQFGFPMLYTRKLPEDVKTPEDVEKYIQSHGQHALVEGELRPGDRLVIVDDLVTKFDSKILAVGQIDEEKKRRNVNGVELKDIVVLIDREQGAAARAEELGYRLHTLIRFKTEGIGMLKESMSGIEYSTIANYLSDYRKYQDRKVQEELTRIAMRQER